MAVDALVPNDPRVEEKYYTFSDDIKYHYLLAKPAGKPTATVLLCHGFPDLAMAWRYQVPYLLSLNLQVIVPNMLGYSKTSAPYPFEEYTMKKLSAHMAGLIKEVTDQPVLLGGHDWGAALVWRIVMYYPELIRCVFSVCVPYWPPSPVKVTFEEVLAKSPNFSYQRQLASGETEKFVDKSPENLRGFVNGVMGGTTADGKSVFTIENGFVEENLPRIGNARLASQEIVDYYVQEFSRHGLHGPANWYRTRDLNGDDDVEFAKKYPNYKFKLPAMLLMAAKDDALPPRLAEGQEKFFEGPFKSELLPNSSHWAMIQCPEEVNKHIGDFFKSVLGDDLKASL
ncbi:Alpha/Beta hydrolase protein [Hypoxylon sp. FL1150]|nr:Alpha/Beta hydrolase protein [Hypoxylon sp. FL1150]